LDYKYLKKKRKEFNKIMSNRKSSDRQKYEGIVSIIREMLNNWVK